MCARKDKTTYNLKTEGLECMAAPCAIILLFTVQDTHKDIINLILTAPCLRQQSIAPVKSQILFFFKISNNTDWFILITYLIKSVFSSPIII
jgi:hypothetical protein